MTSLPTPSSPHPAPKSPNDMIDRCYHTPYISPLYSSLLHFCQALGVKSFLCSCSTKNSLLSTFYQFYFRKQKRKEFNICTTGQPCKADHAIMSLCVLCSTLKKSMSLKLFRSLYYGDYTSY